MTDHDDAVDQDEQALDQLLGEHGLEDRHAALFRNVPPSRWEAHAVELTSAGVGQAVPPHVRLARRALANARKAGNPNEGEMALIAKSDAKQAERRRAMYGEEE